MSWSDRVCPRCGEVARAVSRDFKAPPVDDVDAWAVIANLLERGLRYQRIVERGAPVGYPTTLADARVFATRHADRAIVASPGPLDGGRLARALRRVAPKVGDRELSRAQSVALWDEFIDPDPRHRHYMRLPSTSWVVDVRRSGQRISMAPPPPDLASAGRWVIWWMRERATLCWAESLEAAVPAILQDDDEGVIALSTGTLDVLVSVGGHGLWWRGRRPRSAAPGAGRAPAPAL